jgi:hypothetical protein
MCDVLIYLQFLCVLRKMESKSLPTMQDYNSSSYGFSFSKPTWTPQITIRPANSNETTTSTYSRDYTDHKVCLCIVALGCCMTLMFIFIALTIAKVI